MAASCGLELCGYEVVDPSEVKLDDDATWADYMRADLKLLLDCDYIFMLEGWEDSKGARLERGLAERLGIERVDIDQERERLLALPLRSVADALVQTFKEKGGAE